MNSGFLQSGSLLNRLKRSFVGHLFEKYVQLDALYFQIIVNFMGLCLCKLIPFASLKVSRTNPPQVILMPRHLKFLSVIVKLDCLTCLFFVASASKSGYWSSQHPSWNYYFQRFPLNFQSCGNLRSDEVSTCFLFIDHHNPKARTRASPLFSIVIPIAHHGYTRYNRPCLLTGNPKSTRFSLLLGLW